MAEIIPFVVDEDDDVEDVLALAMENSDRIRSVTMVVEMKDGPVIVRHSAQTPLRLLWASETLRLHVQNLVREDME